MEMAMLHICPEKNAFSLWLGLNFAVGCLWESAGFVEEGVLFLTWHEGFSHSLLATRQIDNCTMFPPESCTIKCNWTVNIIDHAALIASDWLFAWRHKGPFSLGSYIPGELKMLTQHRPDLHVDCCYAAGRGSKKPPWFLPVLNQKPRLHWFHFLEKSKAIRFTFVYTRLLLSSLASESETWWKLSFRTICSLSAQSFLFNAQ